MTEKEFRNLLSEIEFTSKDIYNNIFTTLSDKLTLSNSKFETQVINKVGLYSKQLLIKQSNILEINIVIKCLKEIDETLKNKVIINELENILILEIDAYDVSYDSKAKCINCKIGDTSVKIYIQTIIESEIEVKKNKLCEAINTKYTYFKNTYKLLKYFMYDTKIDCISDEALFVLLTYSSEKYFLSNKYDSYIFNFIRCLDDFINQKQIEIESDYSILDISLNDNLKTYQVFSPFYKNTNLTENINDVNISEVRKFKKRLQKLFEVENTEVRSSIIKLNIEPKEVGNNQIAWRYDVVGRNLTNSGGEFENTELEYLNASLKGYFRGLKAICNSTINNKNITVVTKYKDILKCNTDSNYSEINSRRKTITKYIEENKLLITYQN